MRATKLVLVLLAITHAMLAPGFTQSPPVQDALPTSSPSASPKPASSAATATGSPTTASASPAAPPIAYETEPLPHDPAAALLLASKANGLGGEGLKPWYLKAHYQTYDAQGKPAAKGVFELYWAAKDRYRVSYAEDGFTQTTYHNPDGTYRLGGAGEVPYAEAQIWNQFIHPVELPGKTAVPSLKDETAGKLTQTCVEFQSEQINTSKTLYCLEPKMPLLRTSVFNGYEAVFNKIRVFQRRFTAADIAVLDWGFPLVTINVDELHSLPDLRGFMPPAEAGKITEKQRPSNDGVGTFPESVVAGHSTHKAAPEYPLQAKQNGVQGTVRIAATIGKDGMVHDPKVVHNPDDQLSKAALKAVSQWTYAPYLLNGQPVDVQTQMNVTFTLGR